MTPSTPATKLVASSPTAATAVAASLPPFLSPKAATAADAEATEIVKAKVAKIESKPEETQFEAIVNDNELFVASMTRRSSGIIPIDHHVQKPALSTVIPCLSFASAVRCASSSHQNQQQTQQKLRTFSTGSTLEVC